MADTSLSDDEEYISRNSGLVDRFTAVNITENSFSQENSQTLRIGSRIETFSLSVLRDLKKAANSKIKGTTQEELIVLSTKSQSKKKEQQSDSLSSSETSSDIYQKVDRLHLSPIQDKDTNNMSNLKTNKGKSIELSKKERKKRLY